MIQLRLTQSDNGKTIDLTPDSRLVLVLAENPSTGYRWAIDPIEPPVVALVSNEYTLDPSVGFPGGGTRQLAFRVVRSGEVRLSLRLVRDWDPSAIALRFAAILRVQ
jgi:inhibitor of cysteine peptidase